MRVTDTIWTDILNRLRVGKRKETDLLKINKLVLTNPECNMPDFSTPPWDEAILVMTRHGMRELWNEHSLHWHCKKTGNRWYVIPLEDFEAKIGEKLSMKVRLNVASLKDKKTCHLRDIIQVAVGMKAMVHINFAVEGDIANGTRGTIHSLILDKRDRNTLQEPNGDIHLNHPPALILFQTNPPTSHLTGYQKD